MSYSQAMNGVLFTMASGPYNSSKRCYHCLWTELINKRLGEESSHGKRLTVCRELCNTAMTTRGVILNWRATEESLQSTASIHKYTEFLQLLICLESVCVPVKGAAYQGELPGRGDTEILKANHEQRGWETKGKRVLGKWNNSKGSEAEKSVAL